MNYENVQEFVSDFTYYQRKCDDDILITFKLISNHTLEVFYSELVNIKEENCFFVKRNNASFYIDYSEIIDIIY